MGAIKWPSAELLICVLAALILGTPASEAADLLRDVPVVWYDQDDAHIPEPAERDPDLYWDQYQDAVALPLARFFDPVRAVRRIGSAFGDEHVVHAHNVNSLDEVPNSTWFTNRIGLYELSADEAARGPGDGKGPDRSAPWTVVSAKTQGVTPGFNIRDAQGEVYVIKFDPPGYLGATTCAGVICGRVLHAAGYNVPDDATVTFRREDLVLGDKVSIRLPDGSKRPMTHDDLDAILNKVDRLPTGEWFAISSKFLSGKPAGPFDYRGRRDDDPNDRIDHENRRELRGLELFASWLDHFDTKQHNSLDMYVTEGDRGYLRHHLIDFASTLGIAANGPGQRYAYEYTVDVPAIAGRLVSLGFHESDWMVRKRPEGLDEIGYFVAEPYDPLEFKPLQPNAAFANATRYDHYWAAKIISAFTDEQLLAISQAGGYRNPEATKYMARTLADRRDQIARTLFGEIAPLEFFRKDGNAVVLRDLAEERQVFPGTTPRYRVRCAAVDANRNAAHWTTWEEASELRIPLDRGVAFEAVARGQETRWPFLAIEVAVDRGDGWSNGVIAYMALESHRIVAVDRP